MPGASYDTLDEALGRLSPYGAALTNGNFNHAPMVAEALCALGRPDMVLPWIERYRPRMLPRASVGRSIAATQWREALGQRERFADWSELFRQALRDAEWRDVLELWAGRLAPGVSAAATHGAIRVGHAVRGLAAEETPRRLAELADALASWASSYSELPSADGAGGGLSPREAIARMPIVPAARRRQGNIVAALSGLVEFTQFAPAVARADLDGDILSLLAELSELFARVYLANVHNVPTAIAFIHGVTSLSALGHIAPQVSDRTARSLLHFGWQAGCGLCACYGGGTAFAAAIAAIDQDWEELLERALANGDEHVIKFTEACLSRDFLAPSPAYPAAVANVLTTFAAR